jgi:AhpD family alkylhydroperoxidase
MITMTAFAIPKKEEVSLVNKSIFEHLEKAVGFIPNIYALMAYSPTALDTFLKFENAATLLSKKEVELVKLVVSQENGFQYCITAHTLIGKLNGFTKEEMLEIRSGTASFDSKYNALAVITKEIAVNRGSVSEATINNFLSTGYTKGTLIELAQIVAGMEITNYLHKLIQIPIDIELTSIMKEDDS